MSVTTIVGPTYCPHCDPSRRCPKPPGLFVEGSPLCRACRTLDPTIHDAPGSPKPPETRTPRQETMHRWQTSERGRLITYIGVIKRLLAQPQSNKCRLHREATLARHVAKLAELDAPNAVPVQAKYAGRPSAERARLLDRISVAKRRIARSRKPEWRAQSEATLTWYVGKLAEFDAAAEERMTT